MATDMPTTAPSNAAGFFEGNAGAALDAQGISWGALLAAIGYSFASFGAQLLGFVILRWRLSRIYRPRTYLVPERERVPIPPHGIVGWLKPIFATPSLEYIRKCGLDAYFFLRYLRMLLKIFFPMSVIILPILVPINRYSGDGDDETGIDVLSISNVANKYTGSRFWAHLILAVCSILWVCYIMFQELRGFIRVRQAYLTSPQHRIRASATTVLVTGIPKKWLTLEALEGLYDVFPGGIRNIWINRNFDELSDMVSLRNKYAKNLENAETNLIQLCREKHLKALKKSEKKSGKKHGKKGGNNDDMADARELTPVGSDGTSDRVKEKQPASESPEPRFQDTPRIPTTKSNTSNDMLASPRNPQTTRPEAPRIPTNVLPNEHSEFEIDDQTEQTPDGPLEDKIRASGLRKPGQKPFHDVERADVADEWPAKNRHSGLRKPGQNAYDEVGLREHVDTTVEWPDKVRSSGLRRSGHTASDEVGLRERADMAIERPATAVDHVQEKPDQDFSSSKWAEKLMFWKSTSAVPKEYPSALRKDFDEDKDENATWRKYIKPEDRETIRLPVIDQTWFPSLPLMGKKVDRIYWLRREVARLNLQISDNQNNVERFPYMNSAFIQFNHQVAAHMCCQSVSHHVPQHMSPRTVEISPDDVLWDNLSIKWWERYIRFVIVLVLSIGLLILYAPLVTFTSLVAKLNVLGTQIHWLAWMNDLPDTAKSIIQGILPPALLQLILLLVPIIYRLLVRVQGVPTGNARELGVQIWYFIFLFIQVFLVVSTAGGLITFFTDSISNPSGIFNSLARSLPKAANYFFSYLMIQSLSSSASALVQLWKLVVWFIIGPMFDSTPREKWRRQTTLSKIKWGSFFPPFTNYAVIGIVYSCIAPIILVFMLIIYSLFWIVYRYNVLYVYRFRQDTGGLLFPMAVNQLFTGIYVMEICLAGFFFSAKGPSGNNSCLPQAIIMVVCIVLTAIYQILLNSTFNPLIHYLPITLEDEAVIRDEEFARTQAPIWEARGRASEDGSEDFQHVLAARERAESRADDVANEIAEEEIARRRRLNTPGTQGQGHDSWHNSAAGPLNSPTTFHDDAHPDKTATQDSWHNSQTDTWAARRYAAKAMQPVKGVINFTTGIADSAGEAAGKTLASANARVAAANGLQADDEEALKTVADVLFAGVADELEDLTPEERDLLVRYAFQHSALRARRPIIWIPKDNLGVGEDEVSRAKAVSEFMEYSCKGTSLDRKGRAAFESSPPDLRDVDLIAL